MCRMLSAFRQQLAASCPSYPHQGVELLIELLGSPSHSHLLDFVQPGGAMPRRIYLLAAARDRPTPIDRLDPIHHTREIRRDREITAGEFPQCADSGLSVIYGRKKSCAKQVAQLPCIHAIVFVPGFEQSVLPWIANNYLSHMRLEQVVQPACAGAFLECDP